MGHPGLPVAVGRQEGRARRLHGQWRGLLLHRPQPHCAHYPQRDGAERHAVGPVAVGGARLDLLGGRKHDRRNRARGRQGPGRIAADMLDGAGANVGGDKRRTSAAQRLANALRTAVGPRLRHQEACRGRRHRRRLRQVAGARQRQAGPPAWLMSRSTPTARSRSRN